MVGAKCCCGDVGEDYSFVNVDISGVVTVTVVESDTHAADVQFSSVCFMFYAYIL